MKSSKKSITSITALPQASSSSDDEGGAAPAIARSQTAAMARKSKRAPSREQISADANAPAPPLKSKTPKLMRKKPTPDLPAHPVKPLVLESKKSKKGKVDDDTSSSDTHAWWWEECSCLLVGDDHTGKTTLAEKISGVPKATDCDGALFYTAARDIPTQGRNISLRICDSEAGEAFTRFRVLNYDVSDCFALCVAARDEQHIASVRSVWFPEVSILCPQKPVFVVELSASSREPLRGARTPSKRKKKEKVEKEGREEKAEKKEHKEKEVKPGEALAKEIGALAFLEVDLDDDASVDKWARDVAEHIVTWRRTGPQDNEPSK